MASSPNSSAGCPAEKFFTALAEDENFDSTASPWHLERRRANLSRGRCRSIVRRPGTFSNGHHLGYMGSGFVININQLQSPLIGDRIATLNLARIGLIVFRRRHDDLDQTATMIPRPPEVFYQLSKAWTPPLGFRICDLPIDE